MPQAWRPSFILKCHGQRSVQWTIRSLSFCFRVVKKSTQAVLRHLQPSSETGKRSSSMVDYASITFQFFNLRTFSFQKQFLREVHFQALVSLYSLLLLRLTQPREVQAQLAWKAKGAAHGVSSTVILDCLDLVSDDLSIQNFLRNNG